MYLSDSREAEYSKGTLSLHAMWVSAEMVRFNTTFQLPLPGWEVPEV